MRSPASMRPTACSARCSSAAAPDAADWSKSRCSKRWRISPSSRSRRSSRSASAEVERPAAPRAGLHPAHRGRRPDRDPSLVARKVLAGARERARCADDRRATSASARGRGASTTTRRSAPRSMRSSRGTRSQHWVERLGANDVPFAPINRIDEVVQDPQVRHLGLVVPVERAHGGKQAVRPAVQFDGGARRGDAAPLLDEHGAEIRGRSLRARLARRRPGPRDGPRVMPRPSTQHAVSNHARRQLSRSRNG